MGLHFGLYAWVSSWAQVHEVQVTGGMSPCSLQRALQQLGRAAHMPGCQLLHDVHRADTVYGL